MVGMKHSRISRILNSVFDSISMGAWVDEPEADIDFVSVSGPASLYKIYEKYREKTIEFLKKNLEFYSAAVKCRDCYVYSLNENEFYATLENIFVESDTPSDLENTLYNLKFHEDELNHFIKRLSKSTIHVILDKSSENIKEYYFNIFNEYNITCVNDMNIIKSDFETFKSDLKLLGIIIE